MHIQPLLTLRLKLEVSRFSGSKSRHHQETNIFVPKNIKHKITCNLLHYK